MVVVVVVVVVEVEVQLRWMRRNAMNEAPESQDQYRCTTIEVSIELPHSYEVLSHSLIFFFFSFLYYQH